MLGKKYLGTGAPYVRSGVKAKCRAGSGMGQKLRLVQQNHEALSLEKLKLKF